MLKSITLAKSLAYHIHILRRWNWILIKHNCFSFKFKLKFQLFSKLFFTILLDFNILRTSHENPMVPSPPHLNFTLPSMWTYDMKSSEKWESTHKCRDDKNFLNSTIIMHAAQTNVMTVNYINPMQISTRVSRHFQQHNSDEKKSK